MRLKQIKLAGFKSFVDPTAFEVPSQLVGVVGPNGCGKSNVIDAVRWVLGESKASELRGESMQDVIFNGSADRKPSSRASVELVFDNSLGRIGGSWAGFAEISVKRVLTRDGQSTYLINNQIVRRRDVHDMFLGTGLGPRAYAIIGQGMISRIIEAKPEELRVFLEEAAGVSKYKERRRETENRLSDTRENLTRVEDILRELDAQIDKLERQAEVAQTYREFEADRDRKQRMLWLVRRDESLAEQARIAAIGAELVLAFDAKLAELRSLEAEIERMRVDHYAAGDQVHAAQGGYYETNAEVTRLESEIRFVVESQAQMRERAQRLNEQIQQALADTEAARGGEADARESMNQAQARADSLSERVIALSDRTAELEEDARRARNQRDAARSESQRTGQAIELSATRRHSAAMQLAEAERRRERLESEVTGLQAPSSDEMDTTARAMHAAEEAEATGAQRIEQAEALWRGSDGRRAPAQAALRDAEASLARIEARITALRQVQERVESQGRIAPWLQRHGLDRLGRLWQKLRIEHGWEAAIEAVLRERIASLQVERLDHVAGLVADAPPAKVSFFSAAPGAPVARQALADAKPLASLVGCPEAGILGMLAEWLDGLYTADSVEQACAARTDLPVGCAFVTASGHMVDRHSIRIYAPDAEQDGLLARQFELENLALEQRAQRLIVDQARATAVAAEAAASRAMADLGQIREEHLLTGRQLATHRLAFERLAQAAQRATLTRDRVEAELLEVAAVEERSRGVIDQEGETFDRLDAELAQRQQHVEELNSCFEQAEAVLAEHRESLRRAELESRDASFATRELQSGIERLQAQAEVAERLRTQAGREHEQVMTRLAELSDEAAREGLQAALERRSRAQDALTEARQRLDDLTHALRAREEHRMVLEREQEPLRQRQGELQLKEQAARLAADQYGELLAEHQVDEAGLRAAFGDSPRPSWLQGEVTRLGNAIQVLGPVNLAALDELTQSRERKSFLDAQSADLNSAMATLEDAIRKIDRETRDVLQGTYDAVNRHFGQLFPELFGGGDARLILTGDEILDAGIQVMAHPPGKRNSSIHLLSGGEKALTAIALVFALFQLNPAPFCLLDEVDAPLDDANTERYCDMVRRMSSATQFLFITHNKIAMELAQQLIGVTMQERGVSRIVAVDLELATRLAEAA